jgi:hypothetical protein
MGTPSTDDRKKDKRKEHAMQKLTVNAYQLAVLLHCLRYFGCQSTNICAQ